MPISTAERRRINRQNAAHSTGPTSPEGLARSSRNALKHALRAKKHALATEDPQKAQARARSWASFYRPQTPSQQYTLDQAVEATLMLDRCAGYLRDTLNHQVRQAPRLWDRQREEGVEQDFERLPLCPSAHARALKRSGHGCRRLIVAWEGLAASFERRGGQWSADCADCALLLLGHDPARAQPQPFVELLRLHNLRARGGEEADREGVLGEVPPSVAESRAWLRELMEEELADLRRREAVLRVDYDEPERAEAVGRALLPKDTPEARLLLRYRTTYEMSFYRACKGLKELEEDALEQGRGLWTDAAADAVAEPQLDRVAGPDGVTAGPVPAPAATREEATVVAAEEPYDVSWGLDPADFGVVDEAMVVEEDRGSREDGQETCPAPPTVAEAVAVNGACAGDLPNEANAPVAAAEVPIDSGSYVTKSGAVSDPFGGLRAWIAGPGLAPRPPWICEVPGLATPHRRSPMPEGS
jgi:hypothetical protein